MGRRSVAALRAAEPSDTASPLSALTWWPTGRADRVLAGAATVVSLQLAVVGMAQAAKGALVPAVAGVLAASATTLWWWLAVANGRAARFVLAATLGLAASGAGVALYVCRTALAGPAAGELTGLAATAAGLVMVILAFRIALHGRRRAVQAALGVPAVLVLAQWGLLPVVGAGLATSTRHPPIPPARSLGLAGARDVTFRASDGTRLAGWYVPGRGGAAVMLLHGSHGSRADTAGQLRMLSRAGFAVLAFDARGHGRSAGETNALGWEGAADAAGAAAFLRRQPGLDPGRIGALGLSMGAEEALRAAANGVPLRAIVADGAGASTLGDQELVTRGRTAAIARSASWLSMRMIELLSGESEPAPLADIVQRIRAPVLLIASRSDHELAIDKAFRARIGARADLWYLPDAGHTQGLATYGPAYTRRVIGFLSDALGSPAAR